MLEITLAKLAQRKNVTMKTFATNGGFSYEFTYGDTTYVARKDYEDIIECVKALYKDLQQLEKGAVHSEIINRQPTNKEV